MRFFLPSIAGCALAMLAGCATSEPTASRATAVGVTQSVPAKDLVLWEYRDGVAALRAGKFADAKRLFDDAITTISGIRANDKTAKQARSYFHKESKKTFLGEPYERVMAYYYRGILYWMDGEPDNARACFRSAQLEDSDAEEHAFKSDYVLLDYLDGFASVKLNQDGADAYKRACGLAKGLKLPPYDANANVLVFVEYGNGPEKYSTGKYHEELRFHDGHSVIHNAVVKVDRDEFPAPAYDDLAFQARTRGGRVMDHVLANKAVFKTATGIAGEVGVEVGAAMAIEGSGNAQDAGIALALAGLVTTGISAMTTPQADTRCWDNLPQYLSFTSLKLPPGDHELKVEFEDANGNLLPQYTRRVNLHIPAGARDSVVFVSDKSASSHSNQ